MWSCALTRPRAVARSTGMTDPGPKAPIPVPDVAVPRSALERANARMPSNMDVVFALAQVMYAFHVADFIGPTEAASLRHLVQGNTKTGVADLHAGFTKVTVIQHSDGQVGRLLQCHRGQCAGGAQGTDVDDDVCAGIQVGLLDSADDVRAAEDQQVVVTLYIAWPIGEARAAIVLFLQLVALDHGAHAAVEDQDAFLQGLLKGIEAGTAIGQRHGENYLGRVKKRCAMITKLHAFAVGCAFT